MPKRKRYAIRSSRYHKKRRLTRVPRRIPRGVLVNGPLPRRITARHTYYERVSLNPTASVVASNTYSCNSLYDPDRSGAGHQPLGFDQMTVLYDHYVVIGAKLMARAVSTTSNKAILFCYVTDQNTPLASIDQIMEQRTTRSRRLADGVVSVLSKGVNPAKFLGSKKKRWNENLKGSAGASPAEECYWIVGIGTSDGTDPATVTVEIKIQYTAIWIEPKTLATS